MKNCFPLSTSSIMQGALVGAGSLWPIKALEYVGFYTVKMAVLGAAIPIDAFFNHLLEHTRISINSTHALRKGKKEKKRLPFSRQQTGSVFC
jgi:hypothetical protein